nr:hypothetical protein GCM10020093_062160 [Planobispora longispora]
MSGPFVPFRQFVLKVHSRCDLACDHCYVYEHADQSWRGRPKVISDETVSWAALRIAEHVKEHGLDAVHVVMHGGEPLLAGRDRLARTAAELRTRLDGLCTLDLRIHTNGVLLDERFCDVFAEYGVKVGVSLDGDRAANDRHRRFADGRSSYDPVVRAVRLLRSRPELYAGLLCTIDVANDPIAVYRALADLDPPRIDFLLPHATWDDPPPRPTPTAYADWLIAIFETWAAEGGAPPVRMFESIISTLGGGSSLTESLGLQPSDLVVIETDGSYEQADSLKTAFEGRPRPVCTCCATPSTRSPGTPASSPASRVSAGSATSAARARSWTAAGAGSTPTATGAARGSPTPACSPPTCSSSSPTSAAGRGCPPRRTPCPPRPSTRWPPGWAGGTRSSTWPSRSAACGGRCWRRSTGP